MAVRMYVCHYCGGIFTAAEITVDHIVARALKGEDKRYNMVDSCRKCNTDKGSNWSTCQCSACRRSRRRHWEMFGIRKQRDI